MRSPTLLVLALVLALAPALPAASVEARIEAEAAEPALPSLPAAPAPEVPETTVPEGVPETPEVFPVEPLRVDVAPVGADLTVERRPARSPIDALADIPAPPAPAVAATVGAFALLGGLRWLTVGAIALYSRLSRNELLDHEHREKVVQLVRERPGMGVTQLQQALGLGWGTTVYHLDRLERAGLLASERVGLHRCYFPVGSVPREARKGIGALNADTTRGLAEALVARPGATQSELCAATGLSASALSKQVTKLESAGLVRRERDGKTSRLWPQDGLAQGLARGPVPA